MSVKFTETLAEFSHRTKTKGAFPPLRTFKELCEELGVDMKAMSGKMNRKDAPKPVFKNRGRNTLQASWYNPKEFKTWWKSINET